MKDIRKSAITRKRRVLPVCNYGKKLRVIFLLSLVSILFLFALEMVISFYVDTFFVFFFLFSNGVIFFDVEIIHFIFFTAFSLIFFLFIFYSGDSKMLFEFFFFVSFFLTADGDSGCRIFLAKKKSKNYC